MPRRGGGRSCGTLIVQGVAGEPRTKIFLAHDGHAVLGEIRVTPSVIAVMVRVDQVPGLNGGDRGFDLTRQGRELIIDHDHTVGCHRDGDVSALPFQHV